MVALLSDYFCLKQNANLILIFSIVPFRAFRGKKITTKYTDVHGSFIYIIMMPEKESRDNFYPQISQIDADYKLLQLLTLITSSHESAWW
jgi:hypothetical protein